VTKRQTWSVRALVCLVTKKFVKFAAYAVIEFSKRRSHIDLWSLASVIVTSTTLGSMIRAAGNKTRIAIGDMYSSKFIEFNFSLLS